VLCNLDETETDRITQELANTCSYILSVIVIILLVSGTYKVYLLYYKTSPHIKFIFSGVGIVEMFLVWSKGRTYFKNKLSDRFYRNKMKKMGFEIEIKE